MRCRELQALMDACQVVITCGGIGPTQDDCTVEAVAKAVGTHLEPNAAFAESLRRHFGNKVLISSCVTGHALMWS
jgi:molybdopterin-biosynthesis enzyme MoeA-like protein